MSEQLQARGTLVAYVVDVTSLSEDGSVSGVNMDTARKIGDASFTEWPALEIRDGKTVIWGLEPASVGCTPRDVSHDAEKTPKNGGFLTPETSPDVNSKTW